MQNSDAPHAEITLKQIRCKRCGTLFPRPPASYSETIGGEIVTVKIEASVVRCPKCSAAVNFQNGK